ncbi:MAG: hypothetical protein CO090_02370 [Acidobacteria bacterium CG_4_9_14_3_um_filter_49_7]|nr:MAG: hypothetical protein CO090_02370 [Acidobacteria bacterium CG_4_9_14_3_um_filter_49_7]
MVEEMRESFFSPKAALFPLILLLLVFPPVLRYEFLKVQKIQLLMFFVLGTVFVFRYYRKDTRLSKILFLLFVLFPALYAGAGFFRGYSPYTISKEVLFFVMPLLMVAVFTRAHSFETWTQAIVLFAVAAAVLQIVVFMEIRLAGAVIERYEFRWEFLYETYPVMLVALWMTVGDKSRAGIRKWAIAVVLILGMLATLSRGDFLGMLALLIFSAGGFYRSSRRMRLWVVMLSIAPILYLLVLNLGFQLPGKSFKAWRVYEVQTFMESCGPEHVAFWTGNGFGRELPVRQTLHVYASDTLSEINKFHNFWLYLLSKTGVVGAVLFWGGLLFLFFYVNGRLPDDVSGRFSRFLLGYLAFLCFVGWNYHGGPSMGFQQGALFGLALSLVWLETVDIIPTGGKSS